MSAGRENEDSRDDGAPPQGARDAWAKLCDELSELDPNNFEEKTLNTVINTALELKIDESVQRELVRLTRLVKRVSEVPDGEGESNPDACAHREEMRASEGKCMSWAALVIGALLKPEPEMVVARGLMTSIETELLMRSKWLGWVARKFSDHQMVPIAFGVVVSVITALPWLALLYSVQTNDEFKYIKITVLFAFLGGIASLIVRLPSSSSALQDQNVFVVFWTVFFKPYVGALFGVVIYFTIKSEMIQIVDGEVLDGPHFWGVLGFISGWSERFASDIIDRAAERVPNGTADPRPGIAPGPEQRRDE